MSQTDTRQSSNVRANSAADAHAASNGADAGPCLSVMPECDPPTGVGFSGISESLLVAPRIPKSANTPNLEMLEITNERARALATLNHGAWHESRFAAPAALLVGIAVGLVASWLAGIF